MESATRPKVMVADDPLKRATKLKNGGRAEAGGYDATGLGDAVSHYLTEAVEGIMMVGGLRQDIFSEYVVAIEQGHGGRPSMSPFCSGTGGS